MDKEELIKLIEATKMADIKKFEIKYCRESNYGMHDNRSTQTISYNK